MSGPQKPSFALTPEERAKLFASGQLGLLEPPAPPRSARPPRKRRDKVNVQTVVRLAKAGKTGHEIAKIVGRHPANISYHLRTAGRLTYLTWDEIEWLEKRRIRNPVKLCPPNEKK